LCVCVCASTRTAVEKVRLRINEDKTDKQETIISFSCIIKQDMPQMYTNFSVYRRKFGCLKWRGEDRSEAHAREIAKENKIQARERERISFR
jgi:hypothetical protein